MPDDSNDYPADLKYTAEHEWVRQIGDHVRVGITHHAQDALGDIVFVSLPEPGAEVTAGQPCGEIESTKSVSDVYAPVDGRVVARNDVLESDPAQINNDPYGEGWMIEIEPADPEAVAALLDADTYQAQLD